MSWEKDLYFFAFPSQVYLKDVREEMMRCTDCEYGRIQQR